MERFKGQKPVLFAKWPFDENTKNYRVQIFRKQLSSSVKNNNLGDPRITEKPIVDLNLDKNSLTIPWSSFGAFKIQVTKKVMSIQRPIASLEANIMDEFRWDPVKIKTSPSLFFPTNNQLILAEKNIPIYMKWKSDSFAKKAVFQFSTNEKFKEGSISEFVIDLPMQKFDVTKLNSNSWFWRVKELGDDSETDWSAVNRFRLMKRK